MKGRPPKDPDCVRIDMCIRKDLNKKIVHYQAEQLLKGIEMKKAEAAENFIEELHKFYVQSKLNKALV